MRMEPGGGRASVHGPARRLLAAARHLYESDGFQSVDESITFYRRLEEPVLGAIGQVR